MKKIFLPDDTAADQARAIIESLPQEGSLARFVREMLGQVEDGLGLSVYGLKKELNAAEVAGLMNVSTRWVQENKENLGLVRDGDSIMALRFDREEVFRVDRKMRAEQRQAIRRLAREGL